MKFSRRTIIGLVTVPLLAAYLWVVLDTLGWPVRDMDCAPPTEAGAPGSIGSVIVAGATGAIGREVVAHAVEHPGVSRVVALSRRAIPEAEWPTTFPLVDLEKAKSKLVVQKVDWEELWKNPNLAGDASVFNGAFANHNVAVNALGTTRKDAGSAEQFKHVDYDYGMTFANAVKTHSPSLLHFAQISSQGADATSWFLYMKTKGLVDNAVAQLQFPTTSIWRPGLLGRKDKARFVEKVFGMCVKPMPVETVGKAVLVAAQQAVATVFASPLAAKSASVEAATNSKEPLPTQPSAATNAAVGFYSNSDIYTFAKCFPTATPEPPQK
jgi:oxidoreductase